jgi:uncharacterized protein YbjQ (UPF0145 family)
MIITTTGDVQGQRIAHYIGPISVHLVAGTNLFSDFFASVTDIFGGTSTSYGRQLSGLYERASKLLEGEARKRGANAVIGLHIDFDELSAQGKSMFMLNALGTAVRLVPAERSASPDGGVDAEVMARALRRRALVRELSEGRITVTDDVWDFATSERIAEFTRYVIGNFMDVAESAGARAEKLEKARRYFDALGPRRSAELLFAYLGAGERITAAARYAAALLIRELSLMDYELLLPLISSENTETARWGLQVSTAHRPAYEADDKQMIRDVRGLLPRLFHDRWQRTTTKGMFGREHTTWQCPCGGTPELEDTYCPTCNRDIRGLAPGDLTPQQAADELDEALAVLDELFPAQVT